MPAQLIRVLLVEDDPDTLFVIKILLGDMDKLKVEGVRSGEEAIRKVTAAFMPDLLLMDYMLPVMNGLDTLRELRKLPQTATTPAILMTAHPPEMSTYKDLGVVHVIAKPFDPVALSALIETIWQQHGPTRAQ